jgi:TolA-binding protein
MCSSNKKSKKNKKRFFPLLLLAFFFVSHAWASDRPYMSDVGQFNYAHFLHSQGDYLRAAREFERVIELFPLSPLIPEAHFMLAESYFDAGDLKEARDQFLQFLDNSTDGPFAPFAPFADEARLRLLKIKKLLAETEKAEGPKALGSPGTGRRAE